MGIDLRKEFDNFMRDYGSYILLVRTDRKVRCSCWDDKTQESDKECKSCYGRGFLVTVERHIGRSVATSVPETLSRSIRRPEYGTVSSPSRVYYLKHDVSVRPRDMIIDCKFDQRGTPILTDNYNAYEINTVDLLRGDYGRIEFTKIFCSYDPVEIEVVISNIIRDHRNLVYYIGLRSDTNE